MKFYLFFTTGMNPASVGRKGNDRSPTREKKRKVKSAPEDRKRNGSRSPVERKRRAKPQRDVTAMNESRNSNIQVDVSVNYTPSEAEQMSTGNFVVFTFV